MIALPNPDAMIRKPRGLRNKLQSLRRPSGLEFDSTVANSETPSNRHYKQFQNRDWLASNAWTPANAAAGSVPVPLLKMVLSMES